MFQAREVSRETWDQRRDEFRKRVCELVGVEFHPRYRPSDRAYLNHILSIRRLTKGKRILSVLRMALSNKEGKDAQVGSVANFGAESCGV